ncbi:MAG: prolipoprotein diacylglyceryl transferase [Nanoarchaeota archaeon]|nr:prolipoprotein diacylglyceryl transferase [Nanoarchaeota archaeon]
MFDDHLTHAGWGIHPVLFEIAGIQVTTYAFFILLALCAGGYVYYLCAKKEGRSNENTFYVALAAISGGILGAKLFSWFLEWDTIIANLPDVTAILSGRTIIGGIIGGMIAVSLTKRFLKIKGKRGNLFAPAASIGIAIGRIGCFFAGCCYGVATYLPWGVDFGDGIPRHPTQLYEAVFCLLLFAYFMYAKDKVKTPGLLWKQFLIAYFSYRFLTEFIRPSEVIFLGMTFYQVVCSLGIIYTLAKMQVEQHHEKS